MPDLLNGILRWLDHNRYTALAIILLGGLFFWTYGCQSSTAFRDPVSGTTTTVTRPELEQQVSATWNQLLAEQARIEASMNALIQAGQAAEDELDRQDEQRQSIIQAFGGLIGDIAGGTFNPVQAVTGAVSLIGLIGGTGLLADNRRKNSLIKRLKNGTAGNGPAPE